MAAIFADDIFKCIKIYAHRVARLTANTISISQLADRLEHTTNAYPAHCNITKYLFIHTHVASPSLLRCLHGARETAYTDATWASCGVKSPTTRMRVQQGSMLTTVKHEIFPLLILYSGWILQCQLDSPHKGTVKRKTSSWEIMLCRKQRVRIPGVLMPQTVLALRLLILHLCCTHIGEGAESNQFVPETGNNNWRGPLSLTRIKFDLTQHG